MPSINSRSTKAEILQALQDAETSLAAGPTWDQVWEKARRSWYAVSGETVLLVKDCYNAGAAARRQCDKIIPGLVADIRRFPFKRDRERPVGR